MKYLIFLIPLFVFAGDMDPTSQSSDISSVQSANSSVYGKSFTYRYLVEPLVSLDDQWSSIVTHCSIAGEDLSQVIQTYDGFGSCLFEQVEVLSSEEISKQNIIFHIKLGNQLFDLLFQWEGLSLQDLFNSYTGENPHKLSNQITFSLISDEESLSDFLFYSILPELFNINFDEVESLFQTSSSPFLKREFKSILLHLTPYAEGLLKMTLSFIDSDDVEFYNLDVITNYYVGADEYFVTSIDQYQEKTDEE